MTDVVINVIINVVTDVATMGVYIRPKSSLIIELLLRINLTVFLK